MAVSVINLNLIVFNECPKVLHFHEQGNDKQQEVTIFICIFLFETMRKAQQEIKDPKILEEILSDEASKQQGLEVIMAQHGAPELIEFNQKNLDRMVILKLTITSMTGKQSSNWMT